MGKPRGGKWDGVSPLETRKKSLEKSNGMALAETYPEQFKALLAPSIPDYCEALVRGFKSGDRTCMRLYPEIMGAAGNMDELVRGILVGLGVGSLDDAKRMMERLRQAERVDEETQEAWAVAFLEERAAKTNRRFLGFGVEVEAAE